MNRCPNCAAQNRVGAKFCTSCGFRLPVEDAVPTATNDRSPFATTSTLPWGNNSSATSEPISNEDESGFASWTSEAPDSTANVDSGPGLSWEASPPVNRAVPVSDEMIAALVGDDATPGPDAASPAVADDAPTPETIEQINASSDDEHSAISLDDLPEVGLDDVPDSQIEELPDVEPFIVNDVSYAATASTQTPAGERSSANAPSIDSLLKLARELEYGLIELADAPRVHAAANGVDVDTALLTGALAGLQSDDDLGGLRIAITTAQDRPRDVDVMLDLVLRADSIATLIGERDQLKSAIELALRGTGVQGASATNPGDDQTDDQDQ